MSLVRKRDVSERVKSIAEQRRPLPNPGDGPKRRAKTGRGHAASRTGGKGDDNRSGSDALGRSGSDARGESGSEEGTTNHISLGDIWNRRGHGTVSSSDGPVLSPRQAVAEGGRITANASDFGDAEKSFDLPDGGNEEGRLKMDALPESYLREDFTESGRHLDERLAGEKAAPLRHNLFRHSMIENRSLLRQPNSFHWLQHVHSFSRTRKIDSTSYNSADQSVACNAHGCCDLAFSASNHATAGEIASGSDHALLTTKPRPLRPNSKSCSRNNEEDSSAQRHSASCDSSDDASLPIRSTSDAARSSTSNVFESFGSTTRDTDNEPDPPRADPGETRPSVSSSDSSGENCPKISVNPASKSIEAKTHILLPLSNTHILPSSSNTHILPSSSNTHILPSSSNTHILPSSSNTHILPSSRNAKPIEKCSMRQSVPAANRKNSAFDKIAGLFNKLKTLTSQQDNPKSKDEKLVSILLSKRQQQQKDAGNWQQQQQETRRKKRDTGNWPAEDAEKSGERKRDGAWEAAIDATRPSTRNGKGDRSVTVQPNPKPDSRKSSTSNTSINKKSNLSLPYTNGGLSEKAQKERDKKKSVEERLETRRAELAAYQAELLTQQEESLHRASSLRYSKQQQKLLKSKLRNVQLEQHQERLHQLKQQSTDNLVELGTLLQQRQQSSDELRCERKAGEAGRLRDELKTRLAESRQKQQHILHDLEHWQQQLNTYSQQQLEQAETSTRRALLRKKQLIAEQNINRQQQHQYNIDKIIEKDVLKLEETELSIYQKDLKIQKKMQDKRAQLSKTREMASLCEQLRDEIRSSSSLQHLNQLTQLQHKIFFKSTMDNSINSHVLNTESTSNKT